jgi:hypothetical protein
MNQRSRAALEVQQTDVGIWTVGLDSDNFPLPPNRRRRRSLAAVRSDFIWSVLAVSLLVWMTFVALTLWH